MAPSASHGLSLVWITPPGAGVVAGVVEVAVAMRVAVAAAVVRVAAAVVAEAGGATRNNSAQAT